MRALTARQREVLNFIAQFTDDNGYPPTVREIGEKFGVSLRAVQDHIAALQKKGYVTSGQKRSRSIRVIKDERKIGDSCFIAKVPLFASYSHIKSSVEDSIAELDSSSFINLAEPFVKSGKKYFSIKITDDSLKNVGILNGDIVLFEETENARNEDIVLALIDGNPVLRKYFSESTRIKLQSADNVYQSLYCQDAKLVGVVVGTFRLY